MATFVQDTFTDTNATAITSHTPDVGGAWNTGGGAITIQSNRLICGFFNSGLSYNTTQSSTADYQVSCDVVMVGASAGGSYVGIAGRFNTAASDNYRAAYDAQNGLFELSKYISGSKTSLGTYSTAYVQGQTFSLMLKMSGTTISLLVDGVSRVSVTDTAFSAKGNFAVYLEDVFSQCCLMDNFLAEDISSGGGGGADQPTMRRWGGVPGMTYTGRGRW